MEKLSKWTRAILMRFVVRSHLGWSEDISQDTMRLLFQRRDRRVIQLLRDEEAPFGASRFESGSWGFPIRIMGVTCLFDGAGYAGKEC